MATAPLLFIDWHPDPVMLRLGGFELHYYSILFALGLILAYLGAKRIYKDKGIAPDKLDPLFVYAFLGILVGARLGHCLFYEPGYYLSHPIEMLLPIRDTPTGWQFTGYQGLASHGGALGLIIALWLHSHRHTAHSVLHPPRQPDERRDNRQADRRALGIPLRWV